MDSFDSWSEFYRYRKMFRNKVNSVWNIPIVKRELPLILTKLNNSSRVLEIGASSSNRYKPGILDAFPCVEYKSMDVDRQTKQDFYSLDEITGQYDLIISFEVMEHLPLAEILTTLKKSYEVAAPGGSIILSTPNIFHPHRFWDSTHLTPLRYEEISALLMMAGFKDIRVYRKHTEPFLKKLIRYTVVKPLHKMLDIDFAKTLIVVGKK